MKLKKKISKLLALGMLTNNLYFNSSANTDISNRYETLEGEYITIDDSVDGELVEIEVFGNTVQDPNNLEDIQSVGDLYVDKNGNPILDRQGREQYKINITSCSYYSSYKDFNNKQPLTKTINTSPWSSFYSNNHVTPITDANDSFSLIILRKDNDNILSGQTFFRIFATITDSNGNIIKELGNYTMKKNKEDMTFEKNLGNLKEFVGYNLVISFRDISGDDLFDNFKMGLINSAINDIFPLEGRVDKIEILLPTQLQKVGDVADRLLWSNDLNRYVVEKNIDKTLIKSCTQKYEDFFNSFTWEESDTSRFDWVGARRKSLMEGLPWVGWGGKPSSANYGFGIYSLNKYLRIYQKPEFDSSLEELNDILFSSGGLYLYMPLLNSILIETNITSKLKLPTYEGKTYIFVETENEINPNLKVTVDRLPRIAKNTIEEAENNSTSYNISLARMYVNMLPESLYKDQLQERLSQVFSSDISLDRKSASSNLDVYVKSQNMLSLSLDTNSVTFEDYSGTEPMEKLNAVNISINSSLPYQLNAYMPVEIANSNKSETLPIDILNIKESSETNYQTFENTIDKIILKDGCIKGNDKVHTIDLKLASNQAHKADVYKTVIKFEAEQK